jgi:hypothetical protein
MAEIILTLWLAFKILNIIRKARDLAFIESESPLQHPATSDYR